MRIIVIEDSYKSFPYIIADENGLPKIFDNIESAELEVDNCQEGILLELDTQTLIGH
jgi:hypothetical protein